MEEKIISIIVPIYNAEKYIDRCINSIINQTYKNLEIILVNDGSKDQSGNICDKYAKLDSRIKVIHKDNEGVSKARNTGIDMITGDYVLFADSDDWLELNMCELMIQKAVNEELDVVISEYNNYYENTEELETIKLIDYENTTFRSVITDDSNKYGGFPWNKLMKFSFIQNKFNTEVHYYENLLFFLENSNSATKYGVVHCPLYNYCINDNSAVHTKKYSIKKLSALKALEIIIPLVPEENRDAHKYIYINSYYSNYYNMVFEKLDISMMNEYKENMKKYYKHVIKSKYLSNKQKIKLIILFRFSFIYGLWIKYRK